ncbi:putative dynactin subunit 1 [Apostichopus japonicus]|uniref:Putative dynactin subunit 1 n=1 Tax=Stichopus japonicus TaxID=307972 RepID=A0A2G8LMA1_STIJA|nr:putative dynactin subunit 1 [Apostichopus japonicus]
MGHGASTNTKKIRIEANDVTQIDNVVWNRSNSDGCIVETLNSSRTKVDLLEQQVDEYRDLLQLAEENYGKAQREADRFKKQLSETESAKLEIMDRMEELEDEINNLRSQIEADSSQELSRLIQEKDQEIESLQANVEKLTRDIKVVQNAKRSEGYEIKLVESKQDYFHANYQMKEELRMMEDENRKLSGRGLMAGNIFGF